LVRRAAFDKTAGWDETLCRPLRPFQAEDKDMAIQLALVGAVHRLPWNLVRYRVLPSGHRDSLYEGLKAVDEKWWRSPLEPDSRRRVRRAIRFDAEVGVVQAVADLRTAARGRDLTGLRKASRDLVRSTARWTTVPLRTRSRLGWMWRTPSSSGSLRQGQRGADVVGQLSSE
jgi:hypothetical protein